MEQWIKEVSGDRQAFNFGRRAYLNFVAVQASNRFKVMGEMASDPAIKPSFRLRAIEWLLRMGTTDHRASHDAKIQLARAVPLLKKMIKSQISPSTISMATHLARRITGLSRLKA